VTCDRCGRETLIVTGSYFNTELICEACDAAERAHPQFDEARRIETEAVRRGDYNFPGIGLPPELKGER
jgi:hypothetical protein